MPKKTVCRSQTPSKHWIWLTGLGVVVALAFLLVTVGIRVFTAKPRQEETTPILADTPSPAEPAPVGKHRRVIVATPTPELAAPLVIAPIPEEADTKAVAKSGDPFEAARAKPLPPFTLPPRQARAKDLETQLHAIPQVDLDPDFAKKNKEQIVQMARGLASTTANGHQAFVRRLMRDRSDLAGLPFMLGKACLITSEQSKELLQGSRGLRATVSWVEAKQPERRYDSHLDQILEIFWTTPEGKDLKSCWSRPEGIPALQQIVTAESKDYRLALVRHLRKIKDRQAAEALAKRAVFDVDAEVRGLALGALADRPREHYQSILQKALRYPWRPVVQNAAEAVASLQRKDMLPELTALLYEPDPDAPYTESAKSGEPTHKVRELVRINHHRNCMLCHTPVANPSAADLRALADTPLGPIPSADEPIPPSSSGAYYESREGITVVRADITYLRQDFSLLQKVAKPGPWPELQRYDFLVRNRALTAHEFQQRQGAASVHSDYKEAIVKAIQSLTGEDDPAPVLAYRTHLRATERHSVRK